MPCSKIGSEGGRTMKLFKRKAAPPPFPADRYEPVLRRSICTGETTACVRERETGKLHDLMLIRSEQELKQFAADYGVDPSEVKTVY